MALKLKITLFCILAVFQVTFSENAYSAFWDVRVIDMDTKAPVENAFLIRVWERTIPNPAGGTEYITDIGISVSDKGGRFSQPPGNLFHVYIPLIYHQFESGSCVYKPGYQTARFSKQNNIIELQKIPTAYKKRQFALRKALYSLGYKVYRTAGGQFLYEWDIDYMFQLRKLGELCDIFGKEEEFIEMLQKENPNVYITEISGSPAQISIPDCSKNIPTNSGTISKKAAKNDQPLETVEDYSASHMN